MLTLHTKLDQSEKIDGKLVLRYDLREKSRLRATLDTGEVVAIFTVRGTVLRDGDLLAGDDGRVVQVVAAPEPVYRVTCANPVELLRCAFHLGNRHTQAQIGRSGEAMAGAAAAGFLRIRQDPVLKGMLEGLGARVDAEMAAFEPEAGAYHGAGHGHSHHDDAGGEAGEPSLLARNLLAPVPLRQKIHRATDPKEA
jgi:urease accessory protein